MAREGFEAWREQVSTELAKEGRGFDSLRARRRGGLVIEPLYVETGGREAADLERAHEPRLVADVSMASESLADLAPEARGDGATALLWSVRPSEQVDLGALVGLGAVVDAPVGLPCFTGSASDVTLLADGVAYALRGVPGEPASHTERVFAALDSLEASGARTSVGAVDAAAVAEAGAHAPLAVGYAVAAFVSWLRAAEGAGRDLSVETARAVVSLALSGEVLVDVATVRALRRGLARVTAKAGLAAAPRLLARSLRRGLSTLDPHTNLLRVTNGTVAALAAGAELVAPAPFDVGSKGPSNESALARRMARRTFLVLTHEAHLGRTLDPAGGAYAVEALTDAVGRAAFGYFTELERAGGLEKPAARAELAAWLAQSSAEAERDARTRKRPFVGASEVPDVGAPVRGDFSPSPLGELGLLAPRRDAAPFELVRARASGSPAVLVALVALGGPKEAAARVGFARGLVEVAGARPLLVDASRPDWEATLRASGARVAVLCATDARYEAEAVAAARAARVAGASLVALAGKPGATEAAQREAGVGLYVHLGCDVPAALERLLDAGLGATGARAHGPTAAGEQATEGGVA